MITNILDYLEDTVIKYPGKIGFKDNIEEITFLEFQTKAKKVAMTIPKEMKRKPIVVFLKKGVKELISFIGIVYSGNYYVPIDPGSPMEHINNILNVVEADLIITDLNYIDKLWGGQKRI